MASPREHTGTRYAGPPSDRKTSACASHRHAPYSQRAALQLSQCPCFDSGAGSCLDASSEQPINLESVWIDHTLALGGGRGGGIQEFYQMLLNMAGGGITQLPVTFTVPRRFPGALRSCPQMSANSRTVPATLEEDQLHGGKHLVYHPLIASKQQIKCAVGHREEVYSLIKACFNFCV